MERPLERYPGVGSITNILMVTKSLLISCLLCFRLFCTNVFGHVPILNNTTVLERPLCEIMGQCDTVDAVGHGLLHVLARDV